MAYLLLFFLVILSGLSVLLFKSANPKKIKLLLAFSGAYLLSLSLMHLIPEIYRSSPDQSKIGIFILIGFFIQILLEYFSKGIEHGHITHSHKTHDHSSHGAHEKTHHPEELKGAFPFAVVASLCFHSFLEGMPLAPIVDKEDYFNQLLIGIVLHNIPISIVLMALLLQTTGSTKKAFAWLCVFAFMLPFGAAFSYLLEGNLLSGIQYYNQIILAAVVGIFLHISTTILFESSENHRFNLLKFISILLGAGLAMVEW